MNVGWHIMDLYYDKELDRMTYAIDDVEVWRSSSHINHTDTCFCLRNNHIGGTPYAKLRFQSDVYFDDLTVLNKKKVYVAVTCDTLKQDDPSLTTGGYLVKGWRDVVYNYQMCSFDSLDGGGAAWTMLTKFTHFANPDVCVTSRELFATSYRMPNGNTGGFSYLDHIYSGSGSPTTDNSPLSGGLGQLTDGVTGVDAWSANLGNGPAYEWVAWRITTYPAPYVEFEFPYSTRMDKVLVFMNNDHVGGVAAASSFTVHFGPSLGTYTSTITYTLNAGEIADLTARYYTVNVADNREAKAVKITFANPVNGNQWVFIAEVKFYHLQCAFPPVNGEQYFLGNGDQLWIEGYTQGPIRDPRPQYGSGLSVEGRDWRDELLPWTPYTLRQTCVLHGGGSDLEWDVRYDFVYNGRVTQPEHSTSNLDDLSWALSNQTIVTIPSTAQAKSTFHDMREARFILPFSKNKGEGPFLLPCDDYQLRDTPYCGTSSLVGNVTGTAGIISAVPYDVSPALSWLPSTFLGDGIASSSRVTMFSAKNTNHMCAYWIRPKTDPIYSSCDEIGRHMDNPRNGAYIIKPVNAKGQHRTVYCDFAGGNVVGDRDLPGESCKEIYDIRESTQYRYSDGTYYIRSPTGESIPVYCDMTNGGWTRILHQVYTSTASSLPSIATLLSEEGVYNGRTPNAATYARLDLIEQHRQNRSMIAVPEGKLVFRLDLSGSGYNGQSNEWAQISNPLLSPVEEVQGFRPYSLNIHGGSNTFQGIARSNHTDVLLDGSRNDDLGMWLGQAMSCPGSYPMCIRQNSTHFAQGFSLYIQGNAIGIVPYPGQESPGNPTYDYMRVDETGNQIAVHNRSWSSFSKYPFEVDYRSWYQLDIWGRSVGPVGSRMYLGWNTLNGAGAPIRSNHNLLRSLKPRILDFNNTHIVLDDNVAGNGWYNFGTSGQCWQPFRVLLGFWYDGNVGPNDVYDAQWSEDTSYSLPAGCTPYNAPCNWTTCPAHTKGAYSHLLTNAEGNTVVPLNYPIPTSIASNIVKNVTRLGQFYWGGTYQYTCMIYTLVPNTWTKYTCRTGGGQSYNAGYGNNRPWRTGIKYAEVLFLSNYAQGGQDVTFEFRDFQITRFYPLDSRPLHGSVTQGKTTTWGDATGTETKPVRPGRGWTLLSQFTQDTSLNGYVPPWITEGYGSGAWIEGKAVASPLNHHSLEREIGVFSHNWSEFLLPQYRYMLRQRCGKQNFTLDVFDVSYEVLYKGELYQPSNNGDLQAHGLYILDTNVLDDEQLPKPFGDLRGYNLIFYLPLRSVHTGARLRACNGLYLNAAECAEYDPTTAGDTAGIVSRDANPVQFGASRLPSHVTGAQSDWAYLEHDPATYGRSGDALTCLYYLSETSNRTYTSCQAVADDLGAAAVSGVFQLSLPSAPTPVSVYCDFATTLPGSDKTYAWTLMASFVSNDTLLPAVYNTSYFQESLWIEGHSLGVPLSPAPTYEDYSVASHNWDWHLTTGQRYKLRQTCQRSTETASVPWGFDLVFDLTYNGKIQQQAGATVDDRTWTLSRRRELTPSLDQSFAINGTDDIRFWLPTSPSQMDSGMITGCHGRHIGLGPCPSASGHLNAAGAGIITLNRGAGPGVAGDQVPAPSAGTVIDSTASGGALSGKYRCLYYMAEDVAPTPNPTVTAATLAPRAGGTITIVGTGFYPTPMLSIYISNITMGQECINATYLSPTLIKCEAGPGTEQNLPLVFMHDHYRITTGPIFSYASEPEVSGISPSNGRPCGGTVLTVFGARFGKSSFDLKNIDVGGVPCSSMTWVSETQVLCTTPPNTPDAAPVRVQTVLGWSSNSTALYTRTKLYPTVTSISQSSTPFAAPPITVTITGTRFGSSASEFAGVTLAGVACQSSTWVSDTTVTCQTGSTTSPGQGAVTVSTNPYCSASNLVFTYGGATISQIQPPRGLAQSGTAVVITGKFLDSATQVYIDGQACQGLSVTSDGLSVSCTVPPAVQAFTSTWQSVTFNVTTSLAASGVPPPGVTFTYWNTPIVESVSPRRFALAGGQVVTITGQHFGSSASEFSTGHIGDSINNAVPFASCKFIEEGFVECVTPVFTSQQLGTHPVLISNQGGSSTAGTVTVDILGAPNITRISPSAGEEIGGTTVTIYGRDLPQSPAELSSITFDQAPCEKVAFIAPDAITCVTTVHPAGLVSVTVRTIFGTQTRPALYTYTRSYSDHVKLSVVKPETWEDSQDVIDVVVTLTHNPSSPVRVNCSSDNPEEGVIVDASDHSQVLPWVELTFPLASWDSPQTLHVHGLPDTKRDGDQTWHIRCTAVSEDPLIGPDAPVTPLAIVNKESSPKLLRLQPSISPLLGGRWLRLTCRDMDHIAAFVISDTTLAANESRLLFRSSSNSLALLADASTGASTTTASGSPGNSTGIPLSDVEFGAIGAEIYSPRMTTVGYKPLVIKNMKTGNQLVIRDKLFYSDDCPFEGQFGRGLDCIDCPVGAYCPGGYRMRPRPGYWSPSEDAGFVYECTPPDKCLGCPEDAGAEDCFSGAIVDGQPAGGSRCRFPYEGEFCNLCAPNYYKAASRECLKCADTSSFYLVIMGDVAVWFFIAMSAWWLEDPKNLSHVVALVIAVQEVGGVGQMVSHRLPRWLLTLYEYLYILSGDVSFIKPDCAGSIPFEMDFLIRSCYSLAIGVPLICGTYITGACSRIWHRRSGKPILENRIEHYSNRGIRVIFVYLLLAYYSFSSMAFEALACTPFDDGKYRLASNPDLDCFGGLHLWIFVAAVVIVLGLTIGFPLCYTIFITKNRHRRYIDERFMARFDFLYEPFKESQWLGYMSEISILMVLAMGSTILRDHPKTQYACTGGLFLLIAVWILWKMPYHLRWENWVALGMMAANFMAMTVIYLSQEDWLNPVTEKALVWSLAGLIAGALFTRLYVVLYYVFWVQKPKAFRNLDGEREDKALVAQQLFDDGPVLKSLLAEDDISSTGSTAASDQGLLMNSLSSLASIFGVSILAEEPAPGQASASFAGAGHASSSAPSAASTAAAAGAGALVGAAAVGSSMGNAETGQTGQPAIVVPPSATVPSISFVDHEDPSFIEQLLSMFTLSSGGARAIPAYWSHRNAESVGTVVDVTSEYQAVVQNALTQSCKTQFLGQGRDATVTGHTGLEVIRVERLENGLLWSVYAQRQLVTRDELRRTGHAGPLISTALSDHPLSTSLDVDHTVAERLLFHGTSPEALNVIRMNGFDERVASSGMFGQGIYFGENSSKSDEYSSQTDGGLCYMFIARVTLGLPYVAGQSMVGIRRPPCVENHTEHRCEHPRYHSVIAETTETLPSAVLTKHREFVVYDKSSTYPELLVTYRRIGGHPVAPPPLALDGSAATSTTTPAPTTTATDTDATTAGDMPALVVEPGHVALDVEPEA
eukprot:TRINITY_DN2957_c0_g1_i1.p1 TRINITY_DN2957_c0_g1~~TRINITY_DN2957_c0_g1_i1.p1  ORF type:complete len:3388 (+),score=527.40 TRINITY_DN2957_c0_g1_i1:1057-11220(+)